MLASCSVCWPHALLLVCPSVFVAERSGLCHGQYCRTVASAVSCFCTESALVTFYFVAQALHVLDMLKSTGRRPDTIMYTNLITGAPAPECVRMACQQPMASRMPL